MNIKALSTKTNTNISTIRYYEKNGLLPAPARLPNNYRDYDELAVQYLNFIHYMIGLGFSLRAIKDIIHHIEDKSIDKTYITTVLSNQNEKIQKQLRQLESLKNKIDALSSQTSEIDDFLALVYQLFM